MKCKLQSGKTEKRFMQKKKTHSSDKTDKKKGKPENLPSKKSGYAQFEVPNRM